MLNRLKSFVSTPTSSAPSTPGLSTPGDQTPPAPGSFRAPLPKAEDLAALREAVPCAECDACEDDEATATAPDEEQYPSFPRKFDMDQESEMLGTCKPMHRLALISTDRSDWPHDVASDPASLAFYLGSVHQKKAPPTRSREMDVGKLRVTKEIPGVYNSDETAKLTVLASSVEMEQVDGETSVLVFPDFKVVQSVPITKLGAQELYDQALSPEVGRVGGGSKTKLNSWILPYEAVVLLCSHKTRDKRCHIAAPLLQDVITSTLALSGYSVDSKGSALHDLSNAERLETLLQTQGQGGNGEEAVEGLLREVAGDGKGKEGSKEVGVFNISHLGGHRYSGVMIICFPSGSILYYGRVTPKACVAIVEQTILKGKVLPQHLRGGANLTREAGKTLLDW